jgi:2,4-dienoyl-CoA reductase (NADPH2)
MSTWRKLFSPIMINRCEIKNRISMPAFGLLYCGGDRRPTERLINFYQARAKGGCGLIIVGGVGISLEGSGLVLPTIETDEYIPDWQRLAEAVHRPGARLFLQLFHSGRYQHSILAGGKQAVAPSAVPSHYTRETPRALTPEEIVGIEDNYAAAARRCVEAEVDGVEIIASAGYLISQFLSPVTNLREDEYGGSFANRTRFGLEVIKKVRAVVGPDYPVIMRLSGNDFMPGGQTSKDSIEVAKVFAAAGVDAFNVTGGWHETKVPQLPAMVPRGAYLYLASGIKRAVSVPVIGSNRIVEPVQAERVLRDGLADMVNIGRAQIADPDWANKAKEDKIDDIRPCVDCLQGCMDRLFSGKPVECLCNPQAGHEAERKVSRVKKVKTVVVIGAGPAGLEAGVTAAKRGHHVTIFDHADHIGGQLPLVAAPPGREEFSRLLSYYHKQVQGHGIALKLGKKVAMSDIRRVRPNVVILATGSSQLVPNLPGAGRPEVVMAWDALLDKADLGESVAVIGGGAVGIETAIAIADRGTIDGDTLKFLLKHEAEDIETLKRLVVRGSRKVTILEMLPKIGKDVGITNRWVFLKELEMLGVEVIVEATVKAITDSGVVYERAGESQTLAAKSVVLALGSRPNLELEEELKSAGFTYVMIGDVKAPRKILDAVHEGFLAAMEI